MGERSTYRILVGTVEGNRPLRRPRHHGRIIIKWIFKRCNTGHGLDSSASDTNRHKWQMLVNAVIK
jgi:hypothetical protein